MITLKQLQYELVRCAEKEPERVGLKNLMAAHGCSDHCILGQVRHNTEGCGDLMWVTNMFVQGGREQQDLIIRAADLNNEGKPWGQIVRELGLVPGEQPATECLTAATPAAKLSVLEEVAAE